jgi:hypothetical protein
MSLRKPTCWKGHRIARIEAAQKEAPVLILYSSELTTAEVLSSPWCSP